LLLAAVLIALGLVLRGQGSPGEKIGVGCLLVACAVTGTILYPTKTARATTPTPVSFASFSYERDPAALLTSVTSAGVPTDDNSYGYTALNQLRSVNSSNYAYDHADNLTHLADGATQSFDNANQLCWSAPTTSAGSCGSPPAGATAFAYDARGNRTGMTPPGGSPTTYTYDQANRLTAAAGATYAYSGDGLRMAKTVSGATTAFTWGRASSVPVVLTEGSATAATKYVYGPGNLPLEQVDSAGQVLFFHPDQLGSTRVLTDASGNTAASFTYDSYGRRTAATGTSSTPLGFASQYTDAETGFQYLRARYYDPATGQFLSRDPIEPITRSAYGYVGGNPLNGSDPTGLCGWSDPLDCVSSTVNTVSTVVLDVAAVPPYLLYYGSYNVNKAIKGAINELPEPLQSVANVASFPTRTGLAGLQGIGLGGDIAVDWVKGHTVNDESICDEGKRGYINPFHQWLPGPLKGPQVYLPGIHANGDIDFEW